jgi:hypothetical protein
MLAKVESKTDINQIKFKVDKLIFLHRELNEKYQKLLSAYDEMNAINETQKKTIKELQEANKIVRLAESMPGSNQNTQGIKAKINEYIREIDRCMELINS